MFEHETAGGIGLAAELADAGADVHVEIGAGFQQLAHPGQVLGVAANMSTDEGGARVATDQGGQAVQDGLEGRVRWAGEMPIGMVVQLFPAFIGSIQRIKKGYRVGDVDHDR